MKIQLTIALNQREPWACFCATRRSHLGVIMSSLLRNLVFVFAAVICDMISSSWSSSCADTLDSRGLLINGSRIHSLAVRGSFQQRRLFFTHFASWFGYWRVSQCILKRQEWMIDGCDGENPVIFQNKTTFFFFFFFTTLYRPRPGTNWPTDRYRAAARCLGTAGLDDSLHS